MTGVGATVPRPGVVVGISLAREGSESAADVGGVGITSDSGDWLQTGVSGGTSQLVTTGTRCTARGGLNQAGGGKRVALTSGKSLEGESGGDAAALKPRTSVPGFRERNSTPIVACRRTLCTSGFIPLNRDNDNLTTSYL